MKVNLKVITPNAEDNILEIARVSSARVNKTEEPGLINYLIRNNHWSPFEHAFVTWEIETSKAIGIQLLRHRSNFFQEFSQRYQDVNKGFDDPFETIEFRKQAKDNRQSSTDYIAETSRDNLGKLRVSFYPHATEEQRVAINLAVDALDMSDRAYRAMLDADIARETARFILPMATKTRMYVTQNIRSLIHWMDLRDDGHAQKEVQEIAKVIKKLTIEQLPIISKARGYV